MLNGYNISLTFNQNITLMLTVAFNQFVNPWALASIGWQYYIVYCAWLIVELAFVAIFIVETKGRPFSVICCLSASKYLSHRSDVRRNCGTF